MFDERSLDAYLAVKLQCAALVIAHEQAAAGKAELENGTDEKELAQASITDYLDEIGRLSDLMTTAEQANVPKGKLQSLIVTVLPATVQQDIHDLATA